MAKPFVDEKAIRQPDGGRFLATYERLGQNGTNHPLCPEHICYKAFVKGTQLVLSKHPSKGSKALKG